MLDRNSGLNETSTFDCVEQRISRCYHTLQGGMSLPRQKPYLRDEFGRRELLRHCVAVCKPGSLVTQDGIAGERAGVGLAAALTLLPTVVLERINVERGVLFSIEG